MKVNHALYGEDTPQSRIATSLLYLGLGCMNQGNVEESLSMDRESLQMERAIHRHDKCCDT